MKQWQCKHGHVLGFVNEAGQLMLLRNAMDYAADEPREVDLLGPLTGSMPIRCSICDDVRPWHVSVTALLQLFLAVNDKHAFEFTMRLLEMSKKGEKA